MTVTPQGDILAQGEHDKYGKYEIYKNRDSWGNETIEIILMNGGATELSETRFTESFEFNKGKVKVSCYGNECVKEILKTEGFEIEEYQEL